MNKPAAWLRTTLETVPGLKAYPLDAGTSPQMPYVVFRQSVTPLTTLADVACGAMRSTFDMVLWAPTHGEAWRIAEAIRGVLHLKEDAAAGLRQSLLVSEADGEGGYDEGNDKPVYSVDITYSIQWFI